MPINSSNKYIINFSKVSTVLALMILWFYQIYFCHYVGYTKMITLSTAIYMIRINSLLFVSYCIMNKIGSKKDWRKLVKCFDGLSRNYKKQSENFYILSIKYIIIFIWFLMSTGIEFAQVYLIFQNVRNIQIVYFINSLLHFFMISFMCNILSIIGEYIIFCNKILIGSIQDPTWLTEEKHSKIIETRKLYKLVADSLNYFNAIFGWVIVFVCFGTILQMVLCLNYCLMPIFQKGFIIPIIFRASTYVVSRYK